MNTRIIDIDSDDYAAGYGDGFRTATDHERAVRLRLRVDLAKAKADAFYRGLVVGVLCMFVVSSCVIVFVRPA